jgi:hypothetical protein
MVGRRPGFHLPVGELERVFVLVVPEQPAHPKHLIPLTRARAARSHAEPGPTSMHAAARGCILYICVASCECAVRCVAPTQRARSRRTVRLKCSALLCGTAVRHWTSRLKVLCGTACTVRYCCRCGTGPPGFKCSAVL